MVFLHGFLQNKKVWKDFASYFPSKYRIVCIDLPAHGNSSTYGYINSMEHMAEAVKAVLDHLKLRRYIIVGHSMGGYVSLAFGEKYTDHIIAMVLMNSTAKADSAERIKSRRQMKRLIKTEKEKIIKQLVPNLFNISKWRKYPKERKHLISMANSMNLHSISSSIEGMMRRKEREIIIRFAPYPMLFIIGKNDKILDYKSCIKESGLSNLAEYKLLEDTGHMAMIESGKQASNSMLNFMAKIKS